LVTEVVPPAAADKPLEIWFADEGAPRRREEEALM